MTRNTNDTRRMALELELAGRAVQHTPAASSLYRAMSSAPAPSIGQTGQTHLVFRRIFITLQNINIIRVIIYYIVRLCAHVYTIYSAHTYYYDQDECAKIVRFAHRFLRA